MSELLTYIIKNLTGTDEFSVTEESLEGTTTLQIKTDPSIIRHIIGKEGRTIKNIRRIVAIKAALEGKTVNIEVSEAEG